MLRNLCLSFFLFLSVLASAQIQQGYVKTLGRPNQKGVALSGVSVRVRGEHNAVVSKDDGKFSMPMKGRKNGDAYSLQQVQKAGYELNERGVIGRQYAFSTKVPLTIVMVSTAQLQADKQRIENNAYRVAERNYHAKLAQLEKDKEAGVLTVETYRQELQQLQDKFEKYQSLIDELAEHYAHVDYDNLDTKEREINLCIENGDLERADSLLHTIFDPVDVLKRNQQALSRIDQTVVQATDIIRQANADMQRVLKQQEKDAEYLYQLYTSALARYDNDNAAKYITTRAELDTTNIVWQMDAGQFCCEYLADFQRAMTFMERALQHAKTDYGEMSEETAMAYQRISVIYEQQKNFPLLLDVLQKSYDIRRQIYQEPNAQLAASIHGVAGAYAMQGEFQKGLEMALRALEIRKQVLPEIHIDLAESYHLLGYIYVCTAKFDDGLSNMEQANKIMKALYGEVYLHLADSYHNMGGLYMMMDNYDKSEEYLNKGLQIRRQLFGDKHPKVAESINGLGNLFVRKEKYEEALKFFQEIVDIRINLFGEMSPQVAVVYNNLGVCYGALGDPEKQLEYLQKALHIDQVVFGDQHPETGIAWTNLADYYAEMEKWEKAYDVLTTAASIFVGALGENHPNVAEAYQRLAYVFFKQGNLLKAIKYYRDSLAIYRQLPGDRKASIDTLLGNIDECYKTYLSLHPKNERVKKEYDEFLKNK